MRPLPLVLCCALGLGTPTALVVSPALAAQAASAPAAQTPPPAPKNALAAASSAEAGTEVEPEAVEALHKMSAYLATLQTFEIKTQTSIDLITVSGQRVALEGTAHYKVRRPNGFVIEVNTDVKKRTFYYDGKTFTVVSPEFGFYAGVPAPPTNLQTLDLIWDKFGIALPLEDLFRWNDLKSRRDELTGAFFVGPSTIDGVLTDQYAFRQGQVDWQVWIERGDRPLPRKLMIVDRSQTEQPAYVARLSWTLNPTFAPDAFTFKPGADHKQIRMSTLDAGSTP